MYPRKTEPNFMTLRAEYVRLADVDQPQCAVFTDISRQLGFPCNPIEKGGSSLTSVS